MKSLFRFVCTLLFALINIAHRWVAKGILYAIEIELSDKRQALEYVQDPLARDHILTGYRLTERACEDALAKYNALLPAGQRRTMHSAARCA